MNTNWKGMDVQVQTSSNDRSRTYWTPTMERYFIDLMLEQLHRGNRTGHTFNKQAWTDMRALFNAKFGSQYDKDVLKGRYTNLWKQYNDVKTLLGQSGFSWDESREMVVADESVWNAYLKVHPEARSYQCKAVLNFNDLCIIYGYTTADGRYSRSSHDVDFDDEVQGVNVGDSIGSIATSNNERPRTEWTAAMDQFFIELMLDQIGRGNKADNTFNKQAWAEMLACFNAKFGPLHGKRVLRHRYKKLSKYYGDLKVLLKQNGFSWDESQQMIVADDDVWDAYVKAHPHARAYKMKTFPNYFDLALLFGNENDHIVDCNLHQDNDLEADISGTEAGGGKGSQSHANSDRKRTYWTPLMDRYLIDLLLDQVNQGNRLGQTFISQAWADMVASFNVKFQSLHDKDVLKNRYKYLRRLYNEIKNLLKQSGFSWDETREMITAEDHVWDAYTKVHPDARSYRIKTVPSYQKLCIIYGQEISDGRYIRLAQSETPTLMTGESGVDPVTIDWLPERDRYFIDLMLEQVQGGNKIDHTFNEQAWAHMIESFGRKFGVPCNRYMLEDRYGSLMRDCDKISTVLSQSGFVWDAARQMVTADDAVWETYIEGQSDAIMYRNKVLDNYNDLRKIQRNQVSDADDGRLDGQGVEEQIDNGTFEVAMDGLQVDATFTVEDVENCDQPRKRPSEREGEEEEEEEDRGDSRKLQRIAEEIPRVNPETENAVGGEEKERKDGVNGGVVVNEKKENRRKGGIIERAIDALQAVGDIDDDDDDDDEELLLDACDLLEDEKKAKMFLALNATLRKKWLLRKLRPLLSR